MYNYRETLLGKSAKGKYDADYNFHKFFFQSITSDNKGITELDLDRCIEQLKMDDGFQKMTDKII